RQSNTLTQRQTVTGENDGCGPPCQKERKPSCNEQCKPKHEKPKCERPKCEQPKCERPKCERPKCDKRCKPRCNPCGDLLGMLREVV
ncbi:MAG TPA: hypothetical protein VE269_08200, partial [Gaiellaceae bacterium]|nr:hypothetical protein [Gaiellaceae bacterium]